MAIDFTIINGDVTKFTADALVIADFQDRPFIGRGNSLDRTILNYTGDEMLQERENLCGPNANQLHIADDHLSVLTSAYNFQNYKYIIHVFAHKNTDEETAHYALMSCYLSALSLAAKNGVSSIIFPVIGSNHLLFEQDEALALATKAIKYFIKEMDKRVYSSSLQNITLVTFSKSNQKIEVKKQTSTYDGLYIRQKETLFKDAKELNFQAFYNKYKKEQSTMFTELLKIHISTSDVIHSPNDLAKKLGIDASTISRWANNSAHPSRDNAIKTAIILHLSHQDTIELVYAVDNSIAFPAKNHELLYDYFILRGDYDINKINAAIDEYWNLIGFKSREDSYSVNIGSNSKDSIDIRTNKSATSLER